MERGAGRPLTAALPPGYAASMLGMRVLSPSCRAPRRRPSCRRASPDSACAGPRAQGEGGCRPKASRTERKAKAPRPAAPSLPKTPAEREKTLSDLYALLATSDDEETAKAVTDAIERVWLHSGSATIDVLMERSIKAMSQKKVDWPLKLLDAVVDLAPDYTEAWNRRAYVHFVRKDTERALGDLQAGARARPQSLQGPRRARRDPARDRPEETRAQGIPAAPWTSTPIGPAPRKRSTSSSARSTVRALIVLGATCEAWPPPTP